MSCYNPITLLQYGMNSDSIEFTCRYVLSQKVLETPPNFLDYPLYLLLTVLLELPVYFFFLKPRAISIPKFFKHVVKHVAALNLCTHPLVDFVFPVIAVKMGFSHAIYLSTAETFAVIVEAFYLNTILRQRPVVSFLVALSANLFSWGIGSALIRL